MTIAESVRTASTTRRFTILDGMILVAASAVGFLLWQEYLASLNEMGVSPAEALRETISSGVRFQTLAWMSVLIPIRWRRPRPGRRRLARQPGFVACCAALGTLAFGGLFGLSLWIFRSPGWGYWPFQQLWVISSDKMSWGVAGAWLMLALSGRWKAEKSWTDRLGRLLGAICLVDFVCWVTAALLYE